MKRIGKYRLECELGRGGMGTVWAAYDLQLQRYVAIKLMHRLDDVSPTLLKRFEREARVIARLQNPHVVQIYDYGISDGDIPYIVMELLEGESLAQRLQRTVTMIPAAFLPILSQIAKALDAAHQAGIVHRDLKPANIFLARQGSEVTVKILDFGVAAIHSEYMDKRIKLTGDDQLLGTPQYMSPEQARAQQVDHRTDLWSLAVVAYEALTGRPPFEAGKLTATLMRICMEALPRPSSLVSRLGPEVDAFFVRALAKRPADRFSSARELATAFARLATDSAASRPTKILVVDDEPDLSLLIEQCFWRQIDDGRYEFLFAGDGEQGLERLRDHPDMDIALTDLNMPRMDGLTFLSKLRDVAPTLKAIVISAYSDMNNIRRAMNCGAFDFLIKPLDFGDLEVTIEKAAHGVRELRKALHSIEENEMLRMFVEPSVMERLLPLMHRSETVASESVEATVISIGMPDFQAYAPETSAQNAIELLNRSFDIIVPILATYQGVVTRFLGNTAMAVFRDGKHLVRAIEAGIAIRRRISELAAASPEVLEVRIGIDSGQVLSGSVGSPSRRRFDYAVFGNAVSRARALEVLARPGQILVAESLVEALSPLFHCEENGTAMLDGADRAVSLYDIVAAHEGRPHTTYSHANSTLDEPLSVELNPRQQ